MPMPMCKDSTPWSKAEGPTGPPGALNTTPIPAGLAGTDGSAIASIASPLTLAAALSPSFVSMLVHDCCERYANADFPGAATRLVWLHHVLGPIVNYDAYTAKTPNPSALEARQMPAVQSLKGTPTGDLYQCNYQRVMALLTQLTHDLDYYGQPKNQVTLLSPDSFKANLDAAFAAAQPIEDAWLDYTDQQKSKAINLQTMAHNLQIAKQKQLDDNDEIKKIKTEQDNVAMSIDQLGEELIGLAQDLSQTHQAFLDAVQRQGLPCNFMKVLTLVAAIAATIYTAGAAAGSLAAAWKQEADGEPSYDREQSTKDGLAGLSHRVSTVVQAGDDLQSFINAANKIGTDIAPPAGASSGFQLPSDSAKIIASEKDIEAQLKPFLGMSEAQEYKHALQAFVGTAVARNNKILEYNHAAHNAQLRQLDIDQVELDIRATQTQMAAEASPFVIEAQSFMRKAAFDSRNQIVRLLFLMHRAYRYYSLDDTKDLNITDFSVKSLQVARQNLSTLFTNAYISAGVPLSHIQNVDIDLAPYLGQRGVKELQTKGAATFTLPNDISIFQDDSHVLVSKVAIAFRTQNGPSSVVDVTLIHHGRAVMFDETGEMHLYSHVPVKVHYRKVNNVVQEDGRTASNMFTGLSPYGPWTIQLDTLSKPSASQILGVTLRVWATGHARNNV